MADTIHPADGGDGVPGCGGSPVPAVRVLPPASAPCRSCPYRRDVPSGVWDASEYAKLPPYDAPTWAQPLQVFMCHQQDGRACAGWCHVHDLGHSFAVRVAVLEGTIHGDDVEAFVYYESPVPMFASGREAADHGLADVDAPGGDAVRAIQRLERKQARR